MSVCANCVNTMDANALQINIQVLIDVF